jgi:hypothetical protein
MRVNGLVKWLAVIIAVGVVAYKAAFFAHSLVQERAERRAAEAAMGGRVLPPETARAWAAYVERRVAATISRQEDGSIRIAGATGAAPGQIAVAPPGTPFEIECASQTGGIARFGEGAASITVPIFGASVTDPTAEKPPDLGLDPQSVAASGLSNGLCERALAEIQDIVKPGATAAAEDGVPQESGAGGGAHP